MKGLAMPGFCTPKVTDYTIDQIADLERCARLVNQMWYDPLNKEYVIRREDLDAEALSTLIGIREMAKQDQGATRG